MPELNRSNLAFAQSVQCDGTLYRPKESVPDKIPDSMLEVWVEQGLVKPLDAVAARPADMERVEPAGKQRLDEERAKAAEAEAARKAAAEAAAAAAGQPTRLPPDTALDPALVASMELEELNVLAAERGYAGEPFVESDPAINFLSANFPR